MLNQYFSIYKTIVNQYFSNSTKRKRNNIEPRLFQYYSNAKIVKIILSFTVTTNKNTQPTKTHKPNKHNKTNKHTNTQANKPTYTQPHKTSNSSTSSRTWRPLLSEHKQSGFNPGTFGLWAQHANHCATPLLLKSWIFFQFYVGIEGSRKEGRKQEQKGTESMKWTAKKGKELNRWKHEKNTGCCWPCPHCRMRAQSTGAVVLGS